MPSGAVFSTFQGTPRVRGRGALSLALRAGPSPVPGEGGGLRSRVACGRSATSAVAPGRVGAGAEVHYLSRDGPRDGRGGEPQRAGEGAATANTRWTLDSRENRLYRAAKRATTPVSPLSTSVPSAMRQLRVSSSARMNAASCRFSASSTQARRVEVIAPKRSDAPPSS
jgi:hypothetical protein